MSKITRETIRRIVKGEGGEPWQVYILRYGQFVRTVKAGDEISIAVDIQPPSTFNRAAAQRVVKAILNKGHFQLTEFASGDGNPTIDQDPLKHFMHISLTVEDAPIAGHLVALDAQNHRAGFTLHTRWTPELPPEVKADIWGLSNQRIGWVDINGEAHYDGFDDEQSVGRLGSSLTLTREQRRILKDEITLRHALASVPTIVGDLKINATPSLQADTVRIELINSGFDIWINEQITRLVKELGWATFSFNPTHQQGDLPSYDATIVEAIRPVGLTS